VNRPFTRKMVGNEPSPQTDDVPTSHFVERTTTALKIPFKDTRTTVRGDTKNSRLTMTKQTDSVPPTSRTSRKSMRKAKERSYPHGIHHQQFNGKVLPITSRTPHIRAKQQLNTIRKIGHENAKLSTENANPDTTTRLIEHVRHDIHLAPIEGSKINSPSDTSSSLYESPRILSSPNKDQNENFIDSLVRQHEKEIETNEDEIKALNQEIINLISDIDDKNQKIHEMKQDHEIEIKEKDEDIERITREITTNEDDFF